MEQLHNQRIKLYEKIFHPLLKKIQSKPIGNVGRMVYDVNEKIGSSYKINCIDDCCSLTQTSLYSIVNGIKTGDPICDKIILKLFENAAVFIIADGCGWGQKSYKAALTAANAISFKMNDLSKCKTISDVAKLEVSALQEGDEAILKTSQSLHDIGTTTLLIITIVPYKNKYIGIYCNVGDCACFQYHSETEQTSFVCGKLIDDIKESSHCDGRIGNAQNGLPSLEEISLGTISLEQNDLIMVMTDGVHHNLNPNIRHISYDCTIEESECLLLTNKILTADTICDISENIMGEIINLTKLSRDYHEKYPTKKLPLTYPGKLDHATFGCIKVGSWLHKHHYHLNSIIPSFYDDLLPSQDDIFLNSPKLLPIKRRFSERPKSVFKMSSSPSKSPSSPRPFLTLPIVINASTSSPQILVNHHPLSPVSIKRKQRNQYLSSPYSPRFITPLTIESIPSSQLLDDNTSLSFMDFDLDQLTPHQVSIEQTPRHTPRTNHILSHFHKMEISIDKND